MKFQIFPFAFATVALAWPEAFPTLPPGVPDFTLPFTLPATFWEALPTDFPLPPLDNPPFKLHFHRKGKYIGLPMGVVYNPKDEYYHMYYSEAQEKGASGADVERWFRGAVGHAVSKDLVSWEAYDPVVLPQGKHCFIDGGSVIMRNGEFVMYYGERCCDKVEEIYDVLVCPTMIKRATSGDGQRWNIHHQPVMTQEFYHLTLPSVSYDEKNKQWVMALVGTFELGEPGDSGPPLIPGLPTDMPSMIFKPRFFRSEDGLTSWRPGGDFVIPGSDVYFRVFRPNHLFPYGDRWILTGSTSSRNPVAWVGDMSPNGVFVADAVYNGLDGAAFMDDWAEVPFPVHGSPAGDVMMSLMRTGYKGTEELETRDPYMPVAFPIVFKRAGAPTPALFQGDWIPAVKDLWNETRQPDFTIAADGNVPKDPSASSPAGLYSLKFTMEGPLATEERFVTVEFTSSSGSLVYKLGVRTRVDLGQLRIYHEAIHKDGSEGSGWTRHFPLKSGTQTEVHLLLDQGMAEVKADGYITRDHFRVSNGFAIAKATFENKISNTVTIKDWSFDPIHPVEHKVPLPPSSSVRAAAGFGLFAAALLAVL